MACQALAYVANLSDRHVALCLVITGIKISDGDASTIVNSVASFERWMIDHYSAKAVHRELPLLGIDDNASVVSGTADLVLEMDNGVWIINHKSDQVDDPEMAFNNNRPQMEFYSKLLNSMGYNVLGLGINWFRRSEVAFIKYERND